MNEVNDPLPAKPPKPLLRRLTDATGYSLAGLRTAWRGEQAFRLEVIATAVLLPAGLWLGDDGIERALLAGSLLLVLVAELANSALEAVVDRVGPEHHPLSGNAKDFGSALVMVALVAAGLTWLLVLTG